MVLVYLVGFISIPLMTSFRILNILEVLSDDINLYVYAVCWLDVVMNCITGVYDKNKSKVILEPKKILRYISSFN